VIVLERPPSGEAVGALVFFHGYYGLEDDFRPLLDEIDPQRRYHGYLPRGPVPLAGGRASWFEEDRIGSALDADGPVLPWLDGLPFGPEETVLAGWSQGAGLASLLGLACGRPRPAAIMALGGYYPFDDVPLDLRPPFPPILMAHGRADDVVPVDEVRRVVQRLRAAGATVAYHETEIDHHLDQAVKPALGAFLEDLAARRTT
jgi:phospholipase/carboxylesterase